MVTMQKRRRRRSQAAEIATPTAQATNLLTSTGPNFTPARSMYVRPSALARLMPPRPCLAFSNWASPLSNEYQRHGMARSPRFIFLSPIQTFSTLMSKVRHSIARTHTELANES